MRPDIRTAIQKYYPERKYVNPIDRGTSFSKESTHLVYEVIGDLRHLFERDLTHGSDGNYDLSEKIVIKQWLVLRVSFLGPFAYLDIHNAKRYMEKSDLDLAVQLIQETLAKHEILALSTEEVQEKIDWMEASESLVGNVCRVWNCLFCEY